MGIIPRSISYLFDKIKNQGSRNYTVYCSYLQIYNEKIFDLLNPAPFHDGNSGSSTGLKLRCKYDTFMVDNLYTFECKTKKDMFDLFNFGVNNRIVATHHLNHSSSRSHSLLTITVESTDMQNPVYKIAATKFFVRMII